MHDLSVISTIKSITPIEGKNRIVLANVENYNVIINKEDFKVGDKCIYIFYDSFLPVRDEFEFLRKRCWNEKYQGFRIKPMKMGGVISEGLVLPLSILPEDKKDLKVGTVLDDILGIRNYEELVENEENTSNTKAPPKWYMKFKLVRRLVGKWYSRQKKVYAYPCPKSDEENIEKVWDRVKDSDQVFYRSIKKEGCVRGDTLIQTRQGQKQVRELYKEYENTKEKIDVLSYDSATEIFEFKKASFIKNKPNDLKWYKITTESGKVLFATENHPIYIPEDRIYRETKYIKPGDSLLISD